jgi:predicted SAM-dependent methyltransferase
LQDRPTRLHLGCGEKYLKGYVNVDYPPDEHSVLSPRADVYADVTELSYEPGSVAEVRLHHVFEHFDRPTALRLLIDWYEWLEENGELVIETPDFEAAVRRFARRGFGRRRGTVLRHIFGSHEASWAFHADGWYEEKFRRVLESLGYEVVGAHRKSWRGTDNIKVTARKPPPPWRSRAVQLDRAEELLRASLVDGSPSELRLHRVWVGSLRGSED